MHRNLFPTFPLLLVVLLALIFSVRLVGQIEFDESFEPESAYRDKLDNYTLNFIGFNVAGVFMGEYTVFYDRLITPKFTVGAGIGLMTSTGLESTTDLCYDLYGIKRYDNHGETTRNIFPSPGSVLYLSAKLRGLEYAVGRSDGTADYMLMVRRRQFSNNPYMRSSLSLIFGYELKINYSNNFFISATPGFGAAFFTTLRNDQPDMLPAFTYSLQATCGMGF